MGERSYLSIGDVLTLLREEFPDITISKIRFLESRGLLVPERTPSGYRKFQEHDVDRLRWILRQQRENFLPLKVIKGRLEGQEPSSEQAPMFEVAPGGDLPASLEPLHTSQQRNGSQDYDERTPAEAGAVMARRAAPGSPGRGGVTSPSGLEIGSGGTAVATMATAHASVPDVADAADQISAGESRQVSTSTPTPVHQSASASDVRAAGTSASAGPEQGRGAGSAGAEQGRGASSAGADQRRGASSAGANQTRAASLTAGGDQTRAASPTPGGVPTRGAGPAGAEAAVDGPLGSRVRGGPGQTPDPAGGPGRTSEPATSPAPASSTGASSRRAEAKLDTASPPRVSLTAAELAQASGLDVAQVEELEAYGLIESRLVVGVKCYDDDALEVSGLAAAFARFGVEARHLRLFLHAAERQASLYSQIVMPLLRQRNPDARRRAQDDLTRLTELGGSIQACFAKAVLRDLTRG